MAAAINLRVLQRLDPLIEDILVTVCHVSLYEFSASTHSWHSPKIDGPLHVYTKSGTTMTTTTRTRTSSSPAEAVTGFMILNRNDATGDHVQLLTPDFEFWLKDQFLEYKDSSGRIYCIWFYKVGDASHVYHTLTSRRALMTHKPRK